MALLDSLVVFVVSALVGGLGIHLGARVIVGRFDYGHAVFTALVGALVWAVASWLVRGIQFPVIGQIVPLFAYLAVIKWRYRAGWLAAAGIALVAWIAALLVLTILAAIGIGDLRAIGVPGV